MWASKRKRRNVLVSSASGKVPLLRAVIDASRRIQPNGNVFAGDEDENVLSRFVADGFVTLPATVDANFERIREICIAKSIGTVIPTRDGELGFWAKHSSAFRDVGIEVIVSRPESIRVSVDKILFAEHGEREKLPIVPAWMDLRGNGRYVVKERYGAGGRSVGLNLDADGAIAHAQSLSEPIFQPFIQGQEVSADAWIDQGNRVKGIVLRTRDRVVNGEARVTTTFRNERLETACKRVLESLPLRGPVVVQLVVDSSGLPHVIELNARFGGASTVAITAGLDIWYWALLEADGAKVDDYPFVRIPGEVRQVRVPYDMCFHDPGF